MTSAADVAYLSKLAYPKGYKDKDLYFGLPLLAGMTKKTNFATALGAQVQVDHTSPNGVGGSMGGAVTNRTSTKGASFLVPQAHLYGYAKIEGTVLRNANASGDDQKVVDYAKKQFKDGIQALMELVETRAFRSKTGSLSKITAASGTTITLENAADVLLYKAGMILRASATDGSALAGGTPGYTTVVSTSFANKTITVDGTVTTQITGITAGWFLYRSTLAADNGNGNGGFAGLEDWNPATPTTLFGVNQAVSEAMLSGTRYTDTSNIDTIFIRAEAVARSQVEGGKLEKGEIYLHPLQWAALVQGKLGAQTVDNDASVVNLGVEKLRYNGFTFVRAPHCQVTLARMVCGGNLELHTCGKQPEIGDAVPDVPNDLVEVGLYISGNILTFAPCQNVRVSLPAVSL